jgi:HlyD family secretion protein
VLSIPESALEFVNEKTYVYVKQADNKYKNTLVETGISDGVNIEIKSGISEGDIVRGPKIIEDTHEESDANTTA